METGGSNLNVLGFLLFCYVFGRRRLIFYGEFNNAVSIHVITHCANFRIINRKVIKCNMAANVTDLIFGGSKNFNGRTKNKINITEGIRFPR
jgi:hypothetical protein